MPLSHNEHLMADEALELAVVSLVHFTCVLSHGCFSEKICVAVDTEDRVINQVQVDVLVVDLEQDEQLGAKIIDHGVVGSPCVIVAVLLTDQPVFERAATLIELNCVHCRVAGVDAVVESVVCRGVVWWSWIHRWINGFA